MTAEETDTGGTDTSEKAASETTADETGTNETIPRSNRTIPSGTWRLLALLVLALVPWTVVPTGDYVFAWGLVTTLPFHVTTIADYLFVYTAGLPHRLLAWPVATVLYLLAVTNALLGTIDDDFEDRRVTGGLLVLAGASDLWFSLGLIRPGFLALPVGPVLLWAVAWWFYWPDLRSALWE